MKITLSSAETDFLRNLISGLKTDVSEMEMPSYMRVSLIHNLKGIEEKLNEGKN